VINEGTFGDESVIEEYFHEILILASDGCEWPVSRRGGFTPWDSAAVLID
jgi:hypothetical protein